MRARILIVLVLSFLSSASALQPPRAGRNAVNVRSRNLDVFFIPSNNSQSSCKILYAPGDGGWRGFGVTIAEQLARAGCDVYGLDTRSYLQTFSYPALTPADIAVDYRTLALWIGQGRTERVLLAGWSEGAGLALAAAASSLNHDVFKGVILIGATEFNILAWHWSDTIAELRKTLPNEPTFASRDYIGDVSPLPLFMIASSRDEYVSEEFTKVLFSKAREPKTLAMIDSEDHKYSGSKEVFFRTLARAVQWISQNKP